MAKAELGTAKYYSKKLKAAGLQKLRFYCQLCSKQCRDANGFKNHLNSPSHIRRVGEAGGNAVGSFSERFKGDFLRLLKINHGTKVINANKFYQEYISHDRNHIHMNTTKWRSLTSFIKFLGLQGIVKVQNPDDDEFNLEIQFIDTTEVKNDREKEIKTDEAMTMKFLEKQIERGKEKDIPPHEDESTPEPGYSAPSTINLKVTSFKKKSLGKSVFE